MITAEMTDAIAIEEVPLVPLRDTVVTPHHIAPIGAVRPLSLGSLRKASTSDGRIVLAIQRDGTKDDVARDDLYPVATMSKLEGLNMKDMVAQALVQGLYRVRILGVRQSEGVLLARVQQIADEVQTGVEIEALAESTRTLFAECVGAGVMVPPNLAMAVGQTQDPSVLADLASLMPGIENKERIDVLQATDVAERLRLLIPMLMRRSEVVQMQGKIQNDIAKSMGNHQREMFLREQMTAIRKELNQLTGSQDAGIGLRERIESSLMPQAVKDVAYKEMERLENISSFSPEMGMVQNYLTWLLDLPWGEPENEVLDLDNAARILDEDHYGLPKVKERILEWMAVRQRVLERRRAIAEGQGGELPALKTPILCFVGPPGVGKTSMGHSIARALDRKLLRVSLGGIRDEAEIRGHRRTYIGALPGRIIQAMRHADTKHVVMMLDEIDKIGSDFRGDPGAALLEVLDPEQNKEFSDHYLEVPYDLSQILFITTANVIDTISPPLLDRMEVIRINGYSEEEKFEIARHYILPRQMKDHALDSSEVTFTDDAIKTIVHNYTHEAGVRALERQIAQVLRKIPRRLAETPAIAPIEIRSEDLLEFLGPIRFDSVESQAEDSVGVANGAVVHGDVGGDLVTIEGLVSEGEPALKITGQIGDVMRESAEAALSWVNANGSRYGVRKGFFDNHAIHIHVPAGAIPKDGPSAGVTLATVIVSLASNRPIRHDVAMTGEITLRGNVLPIGGVKDKLLAAHRAGIATFLLPEKNRLDLHDIDMTQLEGMEILFMQTLDDVMSHALVPRPATDTTKRGGFLDLRAEQMQTLSTAN